MLQVGRYIFKRAESSREFEQIHGLNFRTFVNEIPQHPDAGTGRLVDKFHHKNTYFIAVREGRVIGMISVHDQPPFSIADRLNDPSIMDRPGSRPLEVRLLAIEPRERHSAVAIGLLWTLYRHAQACGYTHLYISGFEERLDMYRQLGFEPLGPARQSGHARFVPMAVSLQQLTEAVKRRAELWEKRIERQARNGNHSPLTTHHSPLTTHHSPNVETCLLPGPVTVAPAVRAAFQQPPLYHRGPEFLALFQRVQRLLSFMVGGREVALLNGSGTLANEVIAATLAATQRPSGRGLVLVNGEFGHRLAQQVKRFGLTPRVLSWPWGQPWDLDLVEAALQDEPTGSWVWGVHLESSTGVLNDLPELVARGQKHGSRVRADCISSLGAVPLDLRGVFLASGATGKSLGSYAGIAIVFANTESLTELDTSRVPSYLDLPAALATSGPRFTFPAPTLRALEAALEDYATLEKMNARYERYAALGCYVRQQLRHLSLEPLAEEAHACPVVTTFKPPGDETAETFTGRCRQWGFLIGGQSNYLAERRLVQIATMGAVTEEDCAPLFAYLESQLSPVEGVLSTEY